MARVTVEDCLEEIPNRFSLVLVAAERTKQLIRGEESLLEDDRTNKEIVTALREIAAGQVMADLSKFDENENIAIYGAGSGEDELPPVAFDSDIDALPPIADDELPPLGDLPPHGDALPPSADL